jgi:hypothetical protein
MRLPPGARVYLTTIVSLAGVALATWFGMQAGGRRAGQAVVDAGSRRRERNRRWRAGL